MPLYEYRCKKCGHQFEVHHKVGGAAGSCPVCGGQVKRIFSSVGLIFKGSGFHTTDYRKSTPSEGAKGDGAAKTEERTAKKAPKTEQKVDQKTDQKS